MKKVFPMTAAVEKPAEEPSLSQNVRVVNGQSHRQKTRRITPQERHGNPGQRAFDPDNEAEVFIGLR